MPWRPRTGLPWWDRLPPQHRLIAVLFALTVAVSSPLAWEAYRVRTAVLPAAAVAGEVPGWRVFETRIDEAVEAEVANARIRIDPGTEVHLPPAEVPADKPVEVILKRGGVRLEVGRRDLATAPFVVRTPVATAGVRGTRFRVDVPEALVTEVVVDAGLVSLQGLTGPEVLLRAGEAGVVRDRTPARRTRTVEAARPSILPPSANGASVVLPEDDRPAAETSDRPDRNWSRRPTGR
jgi:ferric-dicitrate binding protein FerR (iron transport regulator)